MRCKDLVFGQRKIWSKYACMCLHLCWGVGGEGVRGGHRSQVLETGHLLSILAVHANICSGKTRALGHDLDLFCADFHFISALAMSMSLLVRS